MKGQEYSANQRGCSFPSRVTVVRHYIRIFELRVIALMLVPPVESGISRLSALCIAIGAGAAGALTMWYDRDIDALMERTRKRLISAGRIAPAKALVFGLLLALWSILLMDVAVDWTAAAPLALTIGFYVFVYTCLAEAAHAAEDRYRWRCGSGACVTGWLIGRLSQAVHDAEDPATNKPRPEGGSIIAERSQGQGGFGWWPKAALPKGARNPRRSGR
jgi:hypothetical protein